MQFDAKRPKMTHFVTDCYGQLVDNQRCNKTGSVTEKTETPLYIIIYPSSLIYLSVLYYFCYRVYLEMEVLQIQILPA